MQVKALEQENASLKMELGEVKKMNNDLQVRVL